MYLPPQFNLRTGEMETDIPRQNLFDKIMVQEPYALKNRYLESSIYRDFLVPRLQASKHVQS